MCGCLVDFLSLSHDHAYQLIFVYTRQLANQLRTAYSSKEVAIATWPFIHSLELFTAVLSCYTSDVLSPLIYPVTQVALGVVQVLPSTAHVPTRLHIVRMLLTVATETNTYIPLAPILLEVSNFHYLSPLHHCPITSIVSISPLFYCLHCPITYITLMSLLVPTACSIISIITCCSILYTLLH